MIAVARKAVTGRVSMAIITWHISSILVILAICAIRAVSDKIDTRPSPYGRTIPFSRFYVLSEKPRGARFWNAPWQVKLRENDTCCVTICADRATRARRSSQPRIFLRGKSRTYVEGYRDFAKDSATRRRQTGEARLQRRGSHIRQVSKSRVRFNAGLREIGILAAGMGISAEIADSMLNAWTR